MKRRSKSLFPLFPLLALLTLLLTGGAARAATYVCSVNAYPESSSYGNYGYLWITTTTGPDCTGTSSSGIFCSTGATATGCTEWSAAWLQSMLNALQQAVQNNQTIYYTTISGKVNNITFRAD